MKSPLVLLQSLLADVGRFDPCVRGLDRDIQTIESRFEHEGIGFLTVALGTFGEHFDRCLATRHFGTIPGFQKKRGKSLPELFWGLTSEVFDSITGALLERPSVSCIKSIRQICRFFKKSEIAQNEALLHEKAASAFVAIDAAIKPLNRAQELRLRHISHYVLRNLRGVIPLDDVFDAVRHGPGAVYEKVSGNQKWRHFAEQVESDLDLFPESGFDLLLVETDKGEFSRTASSSSKSKFVTVAKSVTSRRGITIEPLQRQLYQQGFNTVIRRALTRCPTLSQCIDLTDQSLNQQKALEGSLTGCYSTLDLSAASDRLSLHHVRACFDSMPTLLEGMERCRSESDFGPMQKWAGMGNATTFPVQSVCFALTCIEGILRGRKITERNVRQAAASLRIYGDDIICRTEDTQSVISALEDAGLKINPDKSFTEGNFRESCGEDYFEGIGVKPIYYRVDPRVDLWSNAQIETLVSTSNQLWLEGYYSLSETIRVSVEAQLGAKLPLTHRQSGSLGWVCRGRFLVKTRVCAFLHRALTKALVSVPSRSQDRLDGYPALFKFFLTSLKERGKSHLRETVQRYNNKLRWRWVPVLPVKSDFLP